MGVSHPPARGSWRGVGVNFPFARGPPLAVLSRHCCRTKAIATRHPSAAACSPWRRSARPEGESLFPRICSGSQTRRLYSLPWHRVHLPGDRPSIFSASPHSARPAVELGAARRPPPSGPGRFGGKLGNRHPPLATVAGGDRWPIGFRPGSARG